MTALVLLQGAAVASTMQIGWVMISVRTTAGLLYTVSDYVVMYCAAFVVASYIFCLLIFFAVVQNPTQWLYDTLSACCSANYGWKVDECLGTTTTTTSGLYYPDWSGDNEGCLNDGNEVSFIISSVR